MFGAVHGRDASVLRGGGRLRFVAVALGAVSLLPVAFAPPPAALLDRSAAVAVDTLTTVGPLAVAFLALAAGVAVGVAPVVGRGLAVSLFFALGLRNLGVAVATALPVEGVVVTVVTFYVTQQLAAAAVAAGVLNRSSVGVRSPVRDG